MDFLTPTQFVVLAFAAFRLTRLVRRDDGPAHLILQWRKDIGIPNDGNADGPDEPKVKGGFAEMVQCINCASVWTGLLVAIRVLLVAWFRVAIDNNALAWVLLTGFDYVALALALSGTTLVLSYANYRDEARKKMDAAAVALLK